MAVAAIGFRAHSGWAAMVVASAHARLPEIVFRGRIALIDEASPKTKQPYHTARDLGLAQGEQFVANCAARAEQLAAEALAKQLKLLRAQNHRVESCALLLASGRALPPLEKILGSHPMLHTAEGELFRKALSRAGESCHLQVIGIREREVFDRATAVLGISQPELRAKLNEMGRALGPPWREDEKLAALAAWIALAAPKQK